MFELYALKSSKTVLKMFMQEKTQDVERSDSDACLINEICGKYKALA